MTNQEANVILTKKYPCGKIYYSEFGRFSHSNKSVCVNFSENGKAYKYTGSYESVLVHLNLMQATVIEDVKTSLNPFLAVLNNNNL